MTTRTALDTLLGGLVDFAGLFPPASLSMADAMRRYAEYRDGPNGWALGRFVTPVSRLGELAVHAVPLRAGELPWRLAVIGGAGDVDAISQFNVDHGPALEIDTLEARATTAADVETLRAAAARLGARATPFFVYVEASVADDPEALVRAIKRAGLRAKVRTGGVTPDAFPSAAKLERFIRACAVHDVPFKATAGLHHPLRGEYRLTYEREALTGTMFGFLNVFLAAMFVRAGLDAAEAQTLLEERNAHAFAFDDGGVVWRGHAVPAEALHSAREGFATSFGSCSFTEPMEALGRMGLL